MPVRKPHQQLQHNATAPLRCWDIFMDGYQKRITLAADKMELHRMAGKYLWQQSWNLEKILFKEGKVIIVTDPGLHIVFASSNITAMNGYTASEILGKTPALFQGKDTDENVKRGIREAIQNCRGFHISLINYKKNGEPYYCNIESYPVFNKQKKVVHFIAFETAIHDEY
jgi:PAS domain S-box-containing protein